MISLRLILSLWLFLASTVFALTGFEGESYYPLCAHGCLRAFSTVLLTCSTPDDPITGMMVINVNTRPSCYAGNDVYLTSLAYCVSQQCAREHLSTLQLETFWAKYATGGLTVPAKWSYTEALMKVTEPPTEYLVSKSTTVLNATLLANETVMTLQKNTLYSVQYEGMLEGQYGLVYPLPHL